MDEYFELIDDEEKYLEVLTEGVATAGAGALVGRIAATKLAAKMGVSHKTAEKMKNVATVGGGLAAYNPKATKAALTQGADNAQRGISQAVDNKRKHALKMAKTKQEQKDVSEDSEEVSEDSFVKNLARTAGKYHGQAAETAKKAAGHIQRSKALDAMRKKWDEEKG